MEFISFSSTLVNSRFSDASSNINTYVRRNAVSNEVGTIGELQYTGRKTDYCRKIIKFGCTDRGFLSCGLFFDSHEVIYYHE